MTLVQNDSGRTFADHVFRIAVERGDYTADQRPLFDHNNRGMVWWYLGSYSTKPGWLATEPWRRALCVK